MGWCHPSLGTHAEPPSGQRTREDERGYGGHENQTLLMTSEVDGAIIAGMEWRRNKEKTNQKREQILCGEFCEIIYWCSVRQALQVFVWFHITGTKDETHMFKVKGSFS